MDIKVPKNGIIKIYYLLRNKKGVPSAEFTMRNNKQTKTSLIFLAKKIPAVLNAFSSPILILRTFKFFSDLFI